MFRSLPAIKRVLGWLRLWRGDRPPGSLLLGWLGQWRGDRPPGSPRDPYSRTRAPLKPRSPNRTSAVAVAEPDE